MRHALIHAASIILLSFMGAFAAESFDTLTTTDGKTFYQVKITSTDPGGLHFMHRDGAASVPFEKLPSDIQKKYGYDPEKAADFRRQLEAKSEAAQARVAEEVKAAKAAEVDEKVYSNEDPVIVRGKVLQRLDNGFLIQCESDLSAHVGWTKRNGSSSQGRIGHRDSESGGLYSEEKVASLECVKGLVFLRYSEDCNIADGDRIKILAFEDRTYSYTDTQGVRSTVHAYSLNPPEVAPPAP